MRKTTASFLALGAVIAMSNAASAQQSAPAAPAKDDSAFDEIIVTGTANGVRKFDTSYAISSLTAETIKRIAPLSTADLLGTLPGIFAESSGGEASNVYRVRGIPNEGSFYAFHEDGMPLYPESAGFFFTGDGIMRTDIMTKSFQAVRGGTAPIFATNSTALFNHITRQGGENSEAAARVTLGDSGYYRGDAFWSGKIAEKTYLAAGGYYRYNEGYRDNGFPNDKGGQFRVNLRREFEGGEVRAFAKIFDEHNVFLLPIPLADPNTGASLDKYIDVFTGTMNTSALKTAVFKYRNPDGTIVSENRDLSNGRHTSYNQVGVDLDWSFAGFKIANKARAIRGKLNFDALYSGSALNTAAAFAAPRLAAAQGAFAGTTRLGYAFAGSKGLSVYDPTTDSGLITQLDYRNIQSDFQAISDDLRVTRSFDLLGKHEVTAGVFVTRYIQTSQWRSNAYIAETRSNPRLLDLVAYNAAGGVTGFVTDNGVLTYGSTLFGGKAITKEHSFYLTDTWRPIEALAIDAGFRQVENSATGYSNGLTVANLGDPTTLADNATRAFTAPGARSYKYDVTAWTVGANYTLTPSLGVYARASKAYRGPSEFNILLPIAGGFTSAEQYEAGVKLDTEKLSVFATAFYSKFDPFTASLFETNPTTGAVGFINFIGSVKSPGVEVDFSYRPTSMFSIEGSYTYNDAQIGDFAPAPGAPATARATNSDGNQPIRQPKVYGNIRPSLNFKIGEWDAIADLRYNFVGDRYVDLLNRTLLPKYHTLGAGFTVSNAAWDAQIVGDNLTNEKGITEGNPRTDQLSGQGTAVVNYGRPIFGRSVKVIVTRKW